MDKENSNRQLKIIVIKKTQQNEANLFIYKVHILKNSQIFDKKKI